MAMEMKGGSVDLIQETISQTNCTNTDLRQTDGQTDRQIDIQ